MTPEDYERASAIFHRARSLPDAKREAFIHAACGGDRALMQAVSMLLQHDTDPKIDLSPPTVVGAMRKEVDARTGSHPEMIGKFRIREELGTGGMGIVYRASQSKPDRAVALKVIRRAWLSPESRQRFDLESRLLGRLHHPGIAQVYESGVWDSVTGDAVPYLAMELVEGPDLSTYVNTRQPALQERLALFADICDAVQHAHQKGIIHRDLKPSNILIATVEGSESRPLPKILDFGVARLVDPDASLHQNLTLAGDLVGTLTYMSPEQLDGSTGMVDTRSDVYALGVVLYELLAGRPPIQLDDSSISESIALLRQSRPKRLREVVPKLRGDLDIITSKALEQDAAHRYQSASELRADILAFLNNEPITARHPTLSYQLRKLAVRHRALVTVLAVAAVALLASLSLTTYGLVQAKRAQRAAEAAQTEAERQARIAEEVNAFLNNDLLAQADPRNSVEDITVREAVRRAVETIGDRLQDEPLVRAGVLMTLGDAQLTLDDMSSAEKLLREAYELRRQTLGDDHRDTVTAGVSLAISLRYLNRIDEAITLDEHLLTVCEKIYPEDHIESMAVLNNLASLYNLQGKRKKALAVSERVASVLRVTAPDTEQLVACLINLSHDYSANKMYEQSADVLNECMETCRKTLEPGHPYFSYVLQSQGFLDRQTGHFSRAEERFRQSLSLRMQAFDEDHTQVMSAKTNLAIALFRQEKFEEAGTLLEDVLRIRQKDLGADHSRTILTLEWLALHRSSTGKHDEAVQLAETAYRQRVEAGGEQHDDSLACAENLADIYLAAGMAAEAESLVRRSLESVQPPQDGTIDVTQFMLTRALARAWLATDRPCEAASILCRTMAPLRSDALQHGLGRDRPGYDKTIHDGSDQDGTFMPAKTLTQRGSEGTSPLSSTDASNEMATETVPSIKAIGDWRHGLFLATYAEALDACAAHSDRKDEHAEALSDCRPPACEDVMRNAVTLLTNTFGAQHTDTRKAVEKLSGWGTAGDTRKP